MNRTEIHETAEKLRETAEKMADRYRNGEQKDASLNMSEFFEILLYALTGLAGIPDSGGSDFQTAAINTLYEESMITDDEKNKLHKLRKIRNAFAHQNKIDMGNDAAAKAELAEYRRNFLQIIEWCRRDVQLYRDIAERISAGACAERSYEPEQKQYHGAGHADAGRSQDGSKWLTERDLTLTERIFFMHVQIPVILACVLSVLFGLLYDLSSIAGIAEKHHINLDAVSSDAVLIGLYAAVILLYIFLFNITAHFTCGAAVFILARQATGSVPCAVMLAAVTVLIVTRFSYRLKNAISWVFYGFCILIYLFSVPEIIKKHLGESEPADLYTKLVKYALPMLLYVLIFAVVSIVLRRSEMERPFSKVLSEAVTHARPLHLSIALIAVLFAAAAWLYRGTWSKALILLNRDFYASPAAFWTVHLLLAGLLFYVLGILKRKRMFQGLEFRMTKETAPYRIEGPEN